MTYGDFTNHVYNRTGINLNSYKERQMKRRIDSLIQRYNLTDYKHLLNEIDSNSEFYNRFINYLTINVSEFFRNPQQWKVLNEIIIPQLLKGKGKIKTWSSACSTGEEAYTAAIILKNHLPSSKINVIATDIDINSLEYAKAGIYDKNVIANIPVKYYNKYFYKDKSKCIIRNEIKNCVSFLHHNLLEDEFPMECDIIICRNVMIYFTEHAKEMLYKKFNGSLTGEGVFFVGSTEQIIMPQRYNYVPIETYFYKKGNS